MHVGGEQLPLIVPTSEWKRPSELPDLRRSGVSMIAEDTETRDNGLRNDRGPGWATRDGHVAGVSWAWRRPGSGTVESIYVPLQHPDSDCFDADAVRRWMMDHRRVIPEWVYHNGPYDQGWLGAELSLDPPQYMHDTGLMAFMVDENRLSYKLDSLCEWRGVPMKDKRLLKEAAAAYGWYGEEVIQNLWKMRAEFVGPYGEGDAVSTLMLAENLLPEIECQRMTEAYRLECELTPVTIAMRRRGIRVDVDRAERTRDDLLKQRDEMLEELRRRLGERRTLTIDDARSPQTVEQWFIREKLRYRKTEKTGQIQVDSDWMRHHEHWLPKSIAAIKQITETAEKFIQGYILDFCTRERVHATINQWRGEDGGTRSHRFSIADPPMQQMPSRPEDGWPLTGELAKLVRALFLSEVGTDWGAFDYSQQEYRLIVHVAAALGCRGADEAVRRYCEDPTTDFHNFVVDITGLSRRDAKDANFAKAFGAGVPKFASMIRKSVEEAGSIYETYDEKLPFVKQCSGKCQKKADRTGFIRLLDGARSHFDLWEPAWREEGETYYAPRLLNAARDTWGMRRRLKRAWTHKAMNRKIQGDAARQTKRSMREAYRAGYLPMLQMHDELDFPVTSAKQCAEIAEIMANSVRLRVPMKVDAEVGPTWGDAKTDYAEWFTAKAAPVKRRAKAGANQ